MRLRRTSPQPPASIPRGIDSRFTRVEPPAPFSRFQVLLSLSVRAVIWIVFRVGEQGTTYNALCLVTYKW